MAVNTYTKAGTKATTPAKLDKAVFGVVPTNHQLLKEAYVAYLANGRENNAVVKTRGLVRGGGKKPWRQKGTGRARFGSSRNPIWRGGGIVFGPTGQENYTKQLNVKAKRLAIRQALSLAADAGQITVIEDVVVKQAKTSEVAKLLTKIGATGNTLVVVEAKTPELIQASRNLPGVTLVSARYVNVYDTLNADCIVFSQAALKVTTDWLGDASAKPSTNASTKLSTKEAK
ncbi:MAG TPA: 50S ribosomal protein L4 [Candidatus Saccharimonadales bacterium]|nr:50S ribosomal protein L4 [Candidatus Saccharimonadales bacterium]